MKQLSLFLLLLTVACGRQAPPLPSYYVSHTIELKNDLGQLTIMLPAELDTFYTWYNYTDYSCGHRSMHRVADSDYVLLEESGFFYTKAPDSIYQLSISQPKELDCPKSTGGVDQGFLDQLIAEKIENNQTTEFLIKEIRRINQQDFAILAYESNESEMDLSTLSAYTFYKQQFITIVFQCYATNCPGFIERMEPSLSTIEFNSLD